MGCGKATILVRACGFKPVRNIWCELFMLHPFLGIGALYLFVNKHEPPPSLSPRCRVFAKCRPSAKFSS